MYVKNGPRDPVRIYTARVQECIPACTGQTRPQTRVWKHHIYADLSDFGALKAAAHAQNLNFGGQATNLTVNNIYRQS